ncbi:MULTISPECIES: hypothetical protein [Bacillus cereus group]|uniref:hypothetical protein n=1 Tax=Bacillus cereus group TaxID=86661 RepID=UPI00032DD505|nr:MULTISPECIES: hypothetical protein [Bacillus cereus group]EOP59285.1 hypothetical protein IIW_04916 [Bacillus cereus VD136]EOQ01032.1 hypothetical protein KOY_05429 [Bacillus cereus VDM021]OOG89794.1 hypothetical protein BTH41_04972 [Bacillus mycoides]PEL24279.1 hypothetical protein CN608_18375 [Bacillus pseudomycoides]
MIHRYEIDFSVMYSGKVTDLQSAIIPARSLEEANEKIESEVKRRFEEGNIVIHSTGLHVSESVRYGIPT